MKSFGCRYCRTLATLPACSDRDVARRLGGTCRKKARHCGRAFFFMGPLHATLEEFAADGFTHIEANRPRGRVIRLRTIDRNLDGAYARCVGAPVAMCQVRWSAAVGEAVAAVRNERDPRAHSGSGSKWERLAG